MLNSFMTNLFYKFAYQPLDTWADITPQYVYSAEAYYRFVMLNKTNFIDNLKALRNLLKLEDKELFFMITNMTFMTTMKLITTRAGLI